MVTNDDYYFCVLCTYMCMPYCHFAMHIGFFFAFKHHFQTLWELQLK